MGAISTKKERDLERLFSEREEPFPQPFARIPYVSTGHRMSRAPTPVPRTAHYACSILYVSTRHRIAPIRYVSSGHRGMYLSLRVLRGMYLSLRVLSAHEMYL
eukprot:422391-Rhodomonas_salina.1